MVEEREVELKEREGRIKKTGNMQGSWREFCK